MHSDSKGDVLEYHNGNISTITTPINVDRLEQLLIETKYDTKLTQYIVNGFQHGFELGYTGPRNRRNESHNIPLSVGNPTKLWNKIMKEVQLGRYAGPFSRPPYKNFIQSPIGLVPKDKGKKTRLIFHLSYDFGPSEDQKSVNYHIPIEKCSVKYRDLDHAIKASLKLMETSQFQLTAIKTIFYGKTDLMSTFRAVPLKLSEFWMLLMIAFHPVTKEKYWFVDKMLPFGAGSSCLIYQTFSNALHHIAEYKINRPWTSCTNYLDDFCFYGESEEICNWMVRTFLEICNDIQCPVSEEKTEWASSCMSFLGILLNGKNQTLAVPEDKRSKALNLLKWVIQKRNVTIHTIQRLTGILNFLNKAIIPGRTFTRRMYEKLTWTDNKGMKLKQYHHVKLDREFIEDCQVWVDFLNNPLSGKLCRPFIDIDTTISAITLNFYSDSSGKIGMGAIFNNHWICAMWGECFLKKYNPSIQFLELYALVAAIFTWQDQLKNVRFQIFCDNTGAQDAVNDAMSGCKRCMILLRLLVQNNMKHNRRVFVVYVPTKLNILADALSRADFDRFWKYAPETMHRHADVIPDEIWPPDKIWNMY